MNKIIFFFKDGRQQEEPALWENMNAAKVHSEFMMKHVKKIHMIRINPINGAAPVNIVREKKK